MATSTETISVIFTDPQITEKEMIDRLMNALTIEGFMTARITEVTLAGATTFAQAVVDIAVNDSDLSEVDVALYHLLTDGDCDYEILTEYEDIGGDCDDDE